MKRQARTAAGFSLIELLIVISLISVLAAVLIPSLTSSLPTQLMATAEIVSGDMAYARSLAVLNNSSYRVTFDGANSRYTLAHSGSRTDLNVLPQTPFRSPTSTTTSAVQSLADMPSLGIDAKLAGVLSGPTGTDAVTDLEFGPLGATTRATETVVWLSAGTASGKRYIDVRINPVTGLATVGDVIGLTPAGL